MPKVSIIVPVYNVEQYLKRCVDSILAQTYVDFELILVDDGSPDECGNMCDEFAKKDGRIKVLHKENGGLSSARNAGIEVALGEYIGFVDSDDWVTSDMYEHLVDLVDAYKCEIASASYVFSNGESLLRQPEVKIKKYNSTEALHYYLQEGMSKRIADFPVCIKLYKKDLFDDIRFPEGQLYEDVATNFMLIKRASCYVKSNKICYFYYQNSTSITRGGFSTKDLDVIKVGKQLVDLASTEGNAEILKLAEVKNARSYFSLLTKIAAYGISDEMLIQKDVIKYLTDELRKNYWILMNSTMPFNRKIIMNALCVNINLVRNPVKIIRRMQSLISSNDKI